jgi:outer membrane receptor for ferrienterochelin and colicins
MGVDKKCLLAAHCATKMAPRSWFLSSTALILAVFSSTSARADAPAEDTKAPEAEVEAPVRDESQATTNVASFAPTKLKDSPAVVTVVSGEDIRTSGARDLIDILYLVPGYFMGLDTEGVVGPGFRGLWGHEGKILLMIDGKEMNELLFSNMQLGNEFPVELIERVEVIRGPGSVIYGGSAELSVINIVTRGLQGSTDLMANATYGQMTGANDAATGYGRRKFTASARFVLDSVPGLSMFASASLGQGQRSVRTFVDNGGVTANMEGQSALNPALVQAGVGFRNFQASFLYHHLGTTSVSSPAGPAVTAPMQSVVPVGVAFDSFQAEVIGALRPNSRFEIVPRFNLTYQQPWQASVTNYFYDKSVRRLRGRLLARAAPIDELQISVGGDAMFDHANVLGPIGGYDTSFGPGMSTNVSYQTYAAFVELFSENPIVNIAAGARYDHLSTIGGALVPRLVLLRNVGPVGLKGLFSESFRAPGIENINGGSDLRPERTRIFEFEATLDMTAQQRLSANVFDMLIDAPIAYAFDPVALVDQYHNLGRQGTRGFEVSYRLRTPAARLEANYSFYVPTMADNTPPYTVPGHSDQFFAAPAHKVAIRATFRPWEGFGISPTAILLGPRFARGPGDLPNETAVSVPTQLLANLFVYQEDFLVRGLTVGLGIYNILNTSYSFTHASAATTYGGDQASMPGLDREVMLRLTYFIDPSQTRVPAGSLASRQAGQVH